MRDAGALAQSEEAFRRPLAGDKRTVARVDVAGQQLRRMGVGARYHQSLDAKHVSRQPRGVQSADELLRRHQHLAAEMAAFLLGGQLVFEVNAVAASLDRRV